MEQADRLKAAIKKKIWEEGRKKNIIEGKIYEYMKKSIVELTQIDGTTTKKKERNGE